MKKNISKIITTILVILLLTVPTFLLSAEVNPDYWHETVYGGDSFTINKEVTIPAIPPTLDFLLLEDESGSFNDDIITMQGVEPDYSDGLAAAIWEGLDAEGIDFRGSVAGFVDFAQDGWGGSYTYGNDWVYRIYQDMTDDKATWLSGIGQLKTNNGVDYPEAQLAALKTAADGSAWDSNGDGDTDDTEDTPSNQNPTWVDGRTKIIVLVTDASYHVNGDYGGWPGPTYAATVSALNAENIHVIVLATSGAIGGYASLAAATGGATAVISSDSSDIVEALMTALEEILTDVWYTVDYCDPELTLTIDPATTETDPSYSDVLGGETYLFTETVSVANDVVPGEYYCEVTYYSNGYPEGGSVGTQLIEVTVDPVPVDIDIKPWSWPNSINSKSNGVVPVAILGEFDFDSIDLDTVMFGPNELYPNVAAPAHDITDPDVYEDHHEYPDDEEPYWTANMDSWTDLVFHFHQKECGFVMDDEYGYLTGQLMNGQWFMGQDYVRVLK